MENKAKTILLTATILAGAIGVGAAVASSAGASSPPNAQPDGQYVFACVNQDGKIDYLEFRNPLPHQCWHSGEILWHWAVDPGPTASPSASSSATPSDSPSPSPSPSPSSS
jgi:hypothetical protein